MVHLAFVVVGAGATPLSEILSVNVDGSRNVFEAAVEVGARIVHVSSVAAYGLVRGLKRPLVEESPLRGVETPDAYYPYSKALAELALAEVAASVPPGRVTVLRPHVIAGPRFVTRTRNLDPILRQLGPGRKSFWTLPPLDGSRPTLQLSHEEDVAEAIARACSAGREGMFL
ncbi:MAG: hypothetical protein Kow0069_18450 [Promethearchaeota archaeon]